MAYRGGPERDGGFAGAPAVPFAGEAAAWTRRMYQVSRARIIRMVPGSGCSGRGQVLEQSVPHGQRGRLQPGIDTEPGQQRLDVRAHGGG